jgi:hypothetical protein
VLLAYNPYFKFICLHEYLCIDLIQACRSYVSCRRSQNSVHYLLQILLRAWWMYPNWIQACRSKSLAGDQCIPYPKKLCTASNLCFKFTCIHALIKEEEEDLWHQVCLSADFVNLL